MMTRSQGVRRSLVTALLSAMLLGAVLVWPALAEEADGSIDVKADNAVLDSEGKSAVFSGNVLLRRDDWVLTCDSLTVQYDNSEDGSPVVESARGEGSVVLAGPDMRAEASSGTLNWADNVVLLEGEPTLRRGDNVVRADAITIHLDTREVKLVGVRGRFRLEDLTRDGNAPSPATP